MTRKQSSGKGPSRNGRLVGRVPIRPGEVVVGRQPGPGGIVLDAASAVVSRRHCILIRDHEGQVTIRDVSQNGTTLYGKPQLNLDEPAPLQRGDRILIEGWPEMLHVGRGFEIRAVRRLIDATNGYEAWMWLHYVALYYRRRGAWAFWPKERWGRRIPWKIHVYADSPAQWGAVGESLIPYLQKKEITHKTVNGLEWLYTLWLVEEGRQKGKAFTVYFPDEDRMATVAKELHNLLKRLKREGSGVRIYGDRQLGSTGLLFYRFDQDGYGNPRRNDGIYKPKGVPDPFLKLAREL